MSKNNLSSKESLTSTDGERTYSNGLIFPDDDEKLPFPDSENTCNVGPDTEGYDGLSQYCSFCTDLYDYRCLTLEMVEEIKFLRAEVIRWHQALIKYLDLGWADGLRSDIYDNIFPYFDELDAYQDFVKSCCGGTDPFDNEQQSAFLARLRDGTDETSITYL